MSCPHWRIGFDNFPTESDDFTFFCSDCRAVLDHDCDLDNTVDSEGVLRCSDCDAVRYVRP